MSIKHKFSSGVTDVGGPTYVQPTHWNNDHSFPPFKIWDFNPGVAAASFGIPSTAGATGLEFPINTTLLRGAFDFTNVDRVIMAAGIASVVGMTPSAALRFQYSPSGFPGSWYSFDATGGSAPFISVASGNNASLFLLGSNGAQLSATTVVSPAAKALPQPLSVRLAGYGGGSGPVGLGNIDVFAF